MFKYHLLFTCFITCVTSYAQLFVEKTVTNEVTGSREILVADVDGDGHEDVLNVNRTPNDNFVWIKNNANASSFDTPVEIGNIEFPHAFTTADLDGDGDIDVIGTRLFQPNDRLVWFENIDGQGTFGTAIDIVTLTEGQAIVKAADIDGDLDIDLVVNSRDDAALAWYENLDGLGTFGPSQIIITNYVTFTGLDIGDIDGDGDIDIVGGTNILNRMAWFENTDGLGSFGSPIEVGTLGLAVRFVLIEDIDGDNDLDIIGTGGDTVTDFIAWWENLDGLGTFSLENNISTTLELPFKIVSADFDNDSDTDIAVTVGIEDKVYWFENTDGAGSFGSEQLVSDNLPFTISLDAADLDNDGDIDLVSAPQADSDVIYWYENQTILDVAAQPAINLVLTPNPVDDILTIENNTSIPIKSVVIRTVNGIVLQKIEKNYKNVDVSQLSTGLYFAEIVTNEGRKEVVKFIKE